MSTFGTAEQESLKTNLRSTLGCEEPACILALRVSPGSINVAAILTIPDAPTDESGNGGNGAPATAAAGAVAGSGDALGGVAWRAPLIMAATERLAEAETPRLIQPPAVFQYLVNRLTSCTGGGRARERGGGDGGDARKSAAVCLR